MELELVPGLSLDTAGALPSTEGRACRGGLGEDCGSGSALAIGVIIDSEE